MHTVIVKTYLFSQQYASNHSKGLPNTTIFTQEVQSKYRSLRVRLSVYAHELKILQNDEVMKKQVLHGGTHVYVIVDHS